MISGLQYWVDRQMRTPAAQMALDEAIFEGACAPVVRFYRWAAPAATFGYSQRHAEIPAHVGTRPAIRRWTGGGIVFHGEDLTISLCIPAGHAIALVPTHVFYAQVHQALLSAVKARFPQAGLAIPEDCRPGPACFESPAPNDILFAGRKICGGALRRSRRGVLYQGSLHGQWEEGSLATSLCGTAVPFAPAPDILRRAELLEREKYGTREWNEMR